jgi:uncharacterized protein (UPF0216 family)
MEKSTHTFDQAELELLKEGLKRTYKSALKWLPAYLKFSKR